MIELIIFDLDGVLADTEDIHYSALCNSINAITGISVSEIKRVIHTDGSTTKSKLQYLQRIYHLSDQDKVDIDKLKQKTVLDLFDNIPVNHDKISMLSALRPDYKLAIGTNTRRASANKIVDAMGIRDFFDAIVSIDDVGIEKPDPAIYLHIMDKLGVTPDKTLIIEDSPKGIIAATNSQANVLVATSVESTTLGFVQNGITSLYTNNRSPNGGPGI